MCIIGQTEKGLISHYINNVWWKWLFLLFGGDEVERIEQAEDTIEIFENEIEENIYTFMEQQRIEDMRTMSQSVWNACLMFVCRNCFKGTNKLKDKTLHDIPGFPNKTNYNKYDYAMVNKLCDYYIYLCAMFDKEISIMGFSKLSGIDNNTIDLWGNNERLNDLSFGIYKKLCKEREESLSNKLATGNKNPVGILAILNRHYQWNLPGVSREQTKNNNISLEDLQSALKQLPNMSTTDKQIE
jgi:hypothetical protein